MKRAALCLILISFALVSCKHTYSGDDVKAMMQKNLTFPIKDNKYVGAMTIKSIKSVRMSKSAGKIYIDFDAEIRALMTNFTCSKFVYSCEPVLESGEAYLRNFKLESTDCSSPLPSAIESVVADLVFKAFNDFKFRTLGSSPDKFQKFMINDDNELLVE